MAVGEVNIYQNGACFFEFGERSHHALPHGVIKALVKIFSRQADTQAVYLGIQGAMEVGYGYIRGGRITGVNAGHGRECDGAVFSRMRHGASLVQRRGEGDDTQA